MNAIARGWHALGEGDVRWTAALLFGAVAIGGGYGSLMRLSPWPQATTLRHVAAAPGCTFAGLVGLAPSVRGEPGYYAHLDADADGRSCEASTGGRGGFRYGRRRRR